MTRPARAVHSDVPSCYGQYRPMTIGLLPNDYTKIEVLAAEANLSNSEFARQLIHDALLCVRVDNTKAAA